MVKKIILTLSFLLVTGCSSLTNYTKEIPKANIERRENSQLAIVSTEYADESGIKVNINNKTDRIVEILWDQSKINDGKIALSGNVFEDLDAPLVTEWLLPDQAYTRIIYPRDGVKWVVSHEPLKYPVKLEIVFRNKKIKDRAILIISEGELTETKVNLLGQIVDE